MSYLLTRESGQERKFEAFKGVAATVKRMADEKANGTGTEQRPSLVPLASPKIHPSKGSGAVGLEDIEVLRRSVVSAAPAEDEDVTSAVDLQQRFADAYRIFDRDGNRMLSWREVQKGFRRLGQQLGTCCGHPLGSFRAVSRSSTAAFGGGEGLQMDICQHLTVGSKVGLCPDNARGTGQRIRCRSSSSGSA